MTWLIVLAVFVGAAWVFFWVLNVITIVIEEWRHVDSE